MSPADKIRLGKAIRFARMASQALDDLIYNGDLDTHDKNLAGAAEEHFTDAVARLELLTKAEDALVEAQIIVGRLTR